MACLCQRRRETLSAETPEGIILYGFAIVARVLGSLAKRSGMV
jgi:hypothetical protein